MHQIPNSWLDFSKIRTHVYSFLAYKINLKFWWVTNKLFLKTTSICMEENGTRTELKAEHFNSYAYEDSYNAPMFLRPRTTPTPIMWPTAPHAKVSARVNPARSPVCKPESLTSSFNPAVAFLFADGASPNLPANSMRLVLVTIIWQNGIA